MNVPAAPLSRLDALLGRVTMYRLVTIVLAVLAVISIAFGAFGVLDATIFAPGPMLASLGVLLVASVVANLALGALWRVRPHTESAVITALLLWFLYWPSTDVVQLAWLAAAAALANLSKYVLAIRGRHVFNPAAAGVVLTIVLQELLRVDPTNRLFTTWWVASGPLFWLVLVGALLVLRRTRRLPVGLVLVATTAPLLVIGMTSFGTSFLEAVRLALVSYPLIFLAGFMLSEPLTLPPRRWQQLTVAALAGVVLAWPLLSQSFWAERPDLWIFTSTQELALLAANAVAFAFGQRRGVRLRLDGSREVAPGVWEFSFTPSHRLRATPGQFLELHLPHSGTDRRGHRRVFSIASAPDAGQVRLAMAVPERSSSFKSALRTMEPGTTVRATAVHGDFVLPSDQRPVLLVAGGIGITPFLSQLAADTGHDTVLVYGVTDAAAIPFRDELAATGVPVVLVAPERPGDLPKSWTHVAGDRISADLLSTAVPDLAARHAFVSGPPAMVDAVTRGLRRSCAGVRTDHFIGY